MLAPALRRHAESLARAVQRAPRRGARAVRRAVLPHVGILSRGLGGVVPRSRATWCSRSRSPNGRTSCRERATTSRLARRRCDVANLPTAIALAPEGVEGDRAPARFARRVKNSDNCRRRLLGLRANGRLEQDRYAACRPFRESRACARRSRSAGRSSRRRGQSRPCACPIATRSPCRRAWIAPATRYA